MSSPSARGRQSAENVLETATMAAMYISPKPAPATTLSPATSAASEPRARLAATRPAAAARLPRTLTRAQPSLVTSAAATGAMKAEAATWCKYF